VPVTTVTMAHGSGRAAGQERTQQAAAADQPTEPPPFDPALYAHESETRLQKSADDGIATSPPTKLHDKLRDSCDDLLAVVAAESASRNPRKEAAAATRPKLGSVAKLLVAREDLEWFHLEPPERVLLAMVDGETIVEELLLVSRTDIADGLAIFEALAKAGFIAFAHPRTSG
jgi:hypothetical protein